MKHRQPNALGPNSVLYWTLLADVEGSKCARWLLRRFARSLRDTGAFEVRVNKGQDRLPWFRVALVYLSRYPKRWRINSLMQANGTLRYTVFWLKWAKRHPQARWVAEMDKEPGLRPS